jgi:hypothetical protein
MGAKRYQSARASTNVITAGGNEHPAVGFGRKGLGMADGFGVDTPTAQQITERLLSVGATVSGNPPGPQLAGAIGTGALDSAWSEFISAVQNSSYALSRSVDNSATSFSSLATGATTLDQEEAGAV